MTAKQCRIQCLIVNDCDRKMQSTCFQQTVVQCKMLDSTCINVKLICGNVNCARWFLSSFLSESNKPICSCNKVIFSECQAHYFRKGIIYIHIFQFYAFNMSDKEYRFVDFETVS